VIVLVFLIAPIKMVSSAQITRDYPKIVEANKIFKMNVTFGFAYLLKNATYVETLPSGFTIRTWDMTGIKENTDSLQVKVTGSVYSWAFTPNDTITTLTYLVLSPQTEGNYSFKGEVTDWTVKSPIEGNVIVKKLGCGNGICETTENYSVCPQDCQASSSTTTGTNSNSQPPIITTVRRTTTTTTSSSATTIPGSEIFANKKSSNTGILLLIGGLIIVGVVGFVVFKQIKDKKMKTGLVENNPIKTTEEVKETLDRLKDRAFDKSILRKEKTEMASSELPSFTEQTSKLEIPSMPSELRKNANIKPNATLSIPPLPKKQINQTPQRQFQKHTLGNKKSLTKFAILKKQSSTATANSKVEDEGSIKSKTEDNDNNKSKNTNSQPQKNREMTDSDVDAILDKVIKK